MSQTNTAAPPAPLPEKLQTVSDMMQALQSEIADIKSGNLDDSKARLVARFRGLQLKNAELQIQYSRLFKGRTPDPEMKLIAPSE